MVETISQPQRFTSIIEGRTAPTASTQWFENRNPANPAQLLGFFERSKASEVNQAVEAAQRALPAWSQTPPPVRARVLFRIAELLAQQKEALAQIIVQEMGKTLPESRGDVQSAIDMAQFVASEGRRWYGETTHSELPKRWALTRRRPIGVCGVITAWNAPMATPAWKLFPALLCGNTVVFKPAEDTPATAHELVRLLHEAGLPPGVLNLVHGLGEEAGAALVEHPDVRLISFTGSSEVGRWIAQEAGKRLAKVSLELGGKNALIVMPDAMISAAVTAVTAGAFSVAGQRCAATSRLILHESLYESFLAKLTEATRQLVLGDGLDARTQVCPLINAQQIERVERYVETGLKEGARLLCGGHRAHVPSHPQGFFYEPTIFVDVKSTMTIAREEIFGPVLSVFRVSSLEEAIDVHNASPYGLTGSIFTSDMNTALRSLDQMAVGVGYLNAPTFGSEVHMPFGGLKLSGNGHREAGLSGLDVFSDVQTLYMDYSAKVQNAQYADPTKKTS